MAGKGKGKAAKAATATKGPALDGTGSVAEVPVGPAFQVVEGEHPIGLLRPDPQNPREIDAAAFGGLGVSLEEFGDLAFVFNARTGEYVSGHQRLAALKEAGATTFTVLPPPYPGTDVGRAWIDHPKTGERFYLRIVDWDRQRQHQANLVANSHAIAGRFTDRVDVLLSQFQASAPDLYSTLRMDQLLAFEPAAPPTPAAPPEPPAVGDDDVPEVKEQGEPDSKPGMVYGLGWCVVCECCGEVIDLTEDDVRGMALPTGPEAVPQS